MRLSCHVHVVNLEMCCSSSNIKPCQGHLSIGTDKKNSGDDLLLLVCSTRDKNGQKYKIRNNIVKIFDRFQNEGKITIQLREPAKSIFVSKANEVSLKAFVKVLNAAFKGEAVSDIQTSRLPSKVTASSLKGPKTTEKLLSKSDYVAVSSSATGFSLTLTELTINNCQQRRFDQRIAQLPNLKKLDLSNNQYGYRLDSLLALKSSKIQFLDLSFNGLGAQTNGRLPFEFWQSLPSTLLSLSLSNNAISNVPFSLHRITPRLALWDLSSNAIEFLPHMIGRMKPSLRCLRLSHNKLSRLPATLSWFTGASKLQEIDVSANNMDLIPHANETDAAMITMPVFDPRRELDNVPTLLEAAALAVQSYHIGIKPTDVPANLRAYVTSPAFQVKRISKMSAALVVQTRTLQLNEGEHNDRLLYRLQKGWTVRFVQGTSLLGRRVRVFTDHSPQRDWFELQWQCAGANSYDTLDSYAELTLQFAGPCKYRFLIDDEDDLANPSGSGYVQVAPVLRTADEQQIPLDCLMCQTYITKLLGPLNEWESRLRVAHESGYNMLHLTPPQQLGVSDSAYSIADQLTADARYRASGGFEDIKTLVDKFDKEWGLLTISDVVWNHTAINSPWIREHPDSVYNTHNSPHLRPAYILDRALHYFSKDIGSGTYRDNGLPPELNCEDHLNALRGILSDVIFPALKLSEFFMLHVAETVAAFKAFKGAASSGDVELRIQQDSLWRRLKSSVDLSVAKKIYGDDVDMFTAALHALNGHADAVMLGHAAAAIDAIIGHVRYERVDRGGPRYESVTDEHPLLQRYFANPLADTDAKTDEKLMFEDVKRSALLMACNGWIINADAMQNFAELPSQVYLRRELVCWGDSVKLRFGEKPADSPYLWQRMQEYSELTARVFHGIRLDNCHSTPLHVAEYLLAAARRVRPDLYVVAELFTGSEEIDNIFVNRLGITSLVREALSAGDSHEEGRLVYKYGGEPVGAFIQPSTRPVSATTAHAMFLDQTHDNPCPLEIRTPYDVFPSAALVAMACCSTGSAAGYDLLLPYQVNVVNEKRLYPKWSDVQPGPGQKLEVGHANEHSGIIAGKRILNHLHNYLGQHGYSEVFVDQVTEDVVTVTRHSPQSHQSVVLVARTVFSPAALHRRAFIRPLIVDGVIEEILFEAQLVQKEGSLHRSNSKRRLRLKAEAEEFMAGRSDFVLKTREDVKLFGSEIMEAHESEDGVINEIDFSNFPPGCVAAFKVSLRQPARAAIMQIRSGLTEFGFRARTLSGSSLKKGRSSPKQKDDTIAGIADRLSLGDLNRVLFRCEPEEMDEGNGGGVYDIPGYGRLIYCGLYGFVAILDKLRASNDLGHPFCGNLRAGPWMLGYIVARLLAHPRTKTLGQWFSGIFAHFGAVPHYLLPCYFDAIISGAHKILVDAALKKMSPSVQSGSPFVRGLAMTSLIFCGYSSSSPLPPLSCDISPPQPGLLYSQDGLEATPLVVTLSAGLPHFAAGIFRNWGRDTFIALPGLLLVTERFDEARYIILAYGGALRHGLIPNLLGSGYAARFNCRDAVWFWLQSIKIYCRIKGDNTILSDVVLRLYPEDDSTAGEANTESTLAATMYETLNRQFQGVEYRERNAGYGIDEQMTSEGFNVDAYIDLNTGFPSGGNRWNCGTWMDKMGSSQKAGNKGVPATPRDGSAIELVGLCYSVVTWLETLTDDPDWPYEGVTRVVDKGHMLSWLWGDWAKRLSLNFERCFWIPMEFIDPVKVEPTNELDPKLINLRGIYKDCFGSSSAYSDYQMRPNQCIAMAVAPQLFDKSHAAAALSQVEKHLLGPLGMKTLDSSDWNYVGDYYNSDDSDEYKKAKGFNYHQGPEWVWPVGFYLRAVLQFRGREAIPACMKHLATHWTHLRESQWAALPELTNSAGSHCPDSCSAQAWSSSTLLEFMHDLQQ